MTGHSEQPHPKQNPREVFDSFTDIATDLITLPPAFIEALRALAGRSVTRVFSEGGPRIAAQLIALKLADDVVIITAEKPLGLPGLPALGEEARAALLDPARYRPVDAAIYGSDRLRRWERTD